MAEVPIYRRVTALSLAGRHPGAASDWISLGGLQMRPATAPLGAERKRYTAPLGAERNDTSDPEGRGLKKFADNPMSNILGHEL